MLFHNNHTDTANECFSGPFKGEVLDASLIQVIIIIFLLLLLSSTHTHRRFHSRPCGIVVSEPV